MASKKNSGHGRQLIANNKRARFDYFIEDTVEAGLVLKGTEVKTLRAGRVSLNECYAGEREGELYLYNLYIPDYGHAGSYFQHSHKRPRKLLLHRREINRLIGGISREGMTLVPISLYFNPRGRVKLEIGLAKGKKQHDKRDTIKDRDWKRDKARLMRDKG